MGILIWFLDIHLLCRRADAGLDWPAFLRQAEAFGWSAAAYYVFRALSEHFAAHFPEEVCAGLCLQIRPLEESLVRARSLPKQNKAYDGLSNLLGMTRPAQLKTILTNLFPTPAYMRQRYGKRSGWILLLYYPYRWWNMARQMMDVLRIRRAAKI